jgi:hypothetical protein
MGWTHDPDEDAGRWLGFAARQLEPVAEPGFREDISGFRGVSLDLLAKLVDDDVQVLDLVAIIWSPNRLENLAMGDRDVRVCKQVTKNLKLLRSKANVTPLDRHVTAA